MLPMSTTESFIDLQQNKLLSSNDFDIKKYMANGSLIYSWYNGSCYMYRIHVHGRKTISFYILQFPRCDNFVKIEVGRRQPYWIQNTTIHATFTTS